MTINYQFPYYQNPNNTQNPFFQPQYSQPFIQHYPQQPTQQYPSMSSPTPFRGVETSYVENILRLNLGKIATIYMNFENSQWGSKVFKGEILGAGRDHILLKDNQTGVNYLLLRIYLSYITFDEDIEYEYPFA